MKDSEEKEDRISNLKEMMNNVKDSSDDYDIVDYDEEDEYDFNDEDYEVVSINELINTLNKEDSNMEKDNEEEMEIDDEFIYDPSKNSESGENLEDTPIDEDFIITTKLDDENSFIDDNFASEQFDNIVHAKVGKIPIMSIVGIIVGAIFLIGAIIFSSYGSQRIIDNVASGELSVTVVVCAFLGAILIAISSYKLLSARGSLKSFTEPLEKIENSENAHKLEKKSTPSKSETPIKKEDAKIGEFNLDDIKQENTDSEIEDRPEVEEKPTPNEEEELGRPAKKLTEEEIEIIEEKEYQKAKLDTESIDDIFSEINDLDIDSDDSKKDK